MASRRPHRHEPHAPAARASGARTREGGLPVRAPRDPGAHVALLRGALLERPRDPGLLAQLTAALEEEQRARHRPLEERIRGLEQAALDLEAGLSRGHPVREALALAQHRLAAAYHDAGRPCCAISRFQRSLALAPGDACALLGLGRALQATGRLAAAERALRRAVELTPKAAGTLAYLAWCLRARMRFDEALAVSERSLSIDPACETALRTAAEVRFHAGRHDAARELVARARAAAPGSHEARLQDGFFRLALGDFAGGWPLYEARFDPAPGELNEPRHPQPRWDGSDLAGRTILVEPEQGVGDTLQFVRFLPALQERGALVMFPCACHLMNLMRGCDGIDLLVDPEQAQGLGFDTYLPVCSLAHLLLIGMADLPYRTGYLRADPTLAKAWRPRLATLPGLKVGLAWAGNPEHANDFSRSLDPELLPELAGVSGLSFVSLQVGRRAPRAVSEALGLVDWTDELSDFADTAALVAGLDLIIAVDTAVVHLAGAMGRPVWALVAYDSDYRWLKGRDDSPWYPTVRLFRQPEPLAWPAVLARVKARLAALAAKCR